MAQRQLKIDTFEREQREVFLHSKHAERERQIREYEKITGLSNFKPDENIEKT